MFSIGPASEVCQSNELVPVLTERTGQPSNLHGTLPSNSQEVRNEFPRKLTWTSWSRECKNLKLQIAAGGC